MARTLTFAAARGLARSRLNCACSLTHIRSLTSATNENNINQHYDVIIAGGGAVGSVLARLLLNDNDKSLLSHRHRRPLKVALLEQRSSPPSLENIANSSSKNDKQTPNARAYALSPTSLSYLGPSVLQRLQQTNRLGIYDSMQIWEHDGPAQLHFAGEDLNEAVNSGRLVDLHGLIERNNDTEQHQKQQQSNRRPWLGSVVEDAPLVSAVWDELRNDERIDLIDNVQITSISAPSQNTMGNVEPPPPVEIFTLAADGANSFVRRTLGHSFPMITHSYDRKAVTCTVELDVRKGDMAKTAFQRFLPHGPIALLPVWNSLNNDDAPIYANVVWSTTPSEANHLLSLSGTEFITTLNHHLCQGPNVNPPLLGNNNRGMPHIPIIGTIAKEMDSLLRTANTALTMGTWTESPSRNYFRMPPASARVVGPIMGFDLKLSHVQQGYTAPRVALVGDAAHTVHPMAGQGLNLGMGDVYSLSELIKEAVDSGMDVAGTGLFLDRYNQERMVKGLGTVGGVHGLHELFRCSGSNSSSGGIMNVNALNYGGNASGVESVVGLGRSLGMNVVNGLGPLRRAFAEAAAGAAFSR
eukprot:scaffold12409_cov123-Skeletonema_marinoi.AAC.1